MLKSPLTSVLNQSQSLSDLLDFTTKKNSSSARAQTSCLNMLALDFTSPNDFTRKMRAQTTWMETEVMIWRTVNCWYQFVRAFFLVKWFGERWCALDRRHARHLTWLHRGTVAVCATVMLCLKWGSWNGREHLFVSAEHKHFWRGRIQCDGLK